MVDLSTDGMLFVWWWIAWMSDIQAIVGIGGNSSLVEDMGGIEGGIANEN